MEMRADLLIVGAGMVGSALALAWRHSGLQILLLDGGPLTVKPFDAQAPFEPRVSALSAASQRILERLGAWDGIAQRRATPDSDMHVWDGSGTGQIHFSAASVHAQVLGHIVENRVVQDGLLERLHDSDIGLLPNARLEQLRRSGDEWLLTLADGRQLRAPLVIAADGERLRLGERLLELGGEFVHAHRLAVLTIGFIYEWKKGALEWD
jgi:2-octaprenylphenol hydroxylase